MPAGPVAATEGTLCGTEGSGCRPERWLIGTIRVAGRDIQPPGDAPAGLTCRVYRLRDGRISALPDPADIREALEREIERKQA